MKRLLLTLLLLSPAVLADETLSAPVTAALKFNQWYIGQIEQDNSPLVDPAALKPYVTRDTLRAIKTLYSGDSNDKDMPDMDMFTKSQDFGEDWQQVSFVSSDFDPTCIHVYVAFGEKKDHIVADCMVQEDHKWKIRSVTLIK
ncbi:DUF3828 domain-containing protein [Kosakonia sp. BK9b]